MPRPIERRPPRVDLDPGNLARRPVRALHDSHPAILDKQAVEPDPFGLAARRWQRDRAARPAGQGQDGLLEPNLGEPDGAARELDQGEFEARRGESELGRAVALGGERAFAELQIGGRQQPRGNRPAEGNVGARHRVKLGLDVRAMGRPVDDQRRNQRERHHRDERERDDGQDVAHEELLSTSLRREGAGTTKATIAAQNAAKVCP